MNREVEKLQPLIERAKATLDKAKNAAEVLEAKTEAGIAYDVAKRFAEMKAAHITIRTACYKIMADALVIETRAQCRLADEYDAAQERGDVAKQSDGATFRRNNNLIVHKNKMPRLADIGLSSMEIFKARLIREAEKREPGFIKKILDEKLAAGGKPSRRDFECLLAGRRRNAPIQETKSAERKGKKNNSSAAEVAAKLVLDSGLTHEQAGAETGIGGESLVRVAVAREEGRREAEKAVDPDTLSMSAQEKLAAAIRQATRNLELEFEQRLMAECRKRIEETILPAYDRDHAHYQAVIKGRKGVMDRFTYRKILSCLHPDRIQDEGLKKRYAEAFNLFTEMEKVILDEDDFPTPNFKMPKTYAEMMALRQKVSEERKAARATKH